MKTCKSESESEEDQQVRERLEEPTNEDVEPGSPKCQSTTFLPTDVSLKVEGKLFYLNRNRLAENSPYFKAMFESEFEEKHAEVIPLPGKKFKEFEMFLFSFYFPENICPVKEDNVLIILPLADEYQVQSVIDECTNVLVEMFKEPKRHNMDVHAFIDHLKYAEQYNLKQVLSLAPKQGAKYTIKLLKDAGLDEKISTEIRKDIYEEKCKQSESFCTDSMRYIRSSSQYSYYGRNEDTKNQEVRRKFEGFLVETIDQLPMFKFDVSVIVDLIIMAEDYSFENLKQHAIVQASMFSSEELQDDKNYRKISSEIRQQLERK